MWVIPYFFKRKGVRNIVPSHKTIGVDETINSQTITVLEKDANGDVLRATGIVTVTDGGAWYAKGCLYIDTDVAGGTSGLFVNVGTTTSCNFDLVTDAA